MQAARAAADTLLWKVMMDLRGAATLAAAIVGVVFTVMLLNASSRSVVPQCSEAVCHGVIVDAGSSGCRVHVFRWDGRVPAAERTVTPVGREEFTPGIATYVDGRSEAAWTGDVEAYVDRWARAAATLLPQDAVDAVWWKVYGTAGMRLLAPGDQDALVAAIRAHLVRARPSDHVLDVRVIPGALEGLFAWLSAERRTVLDLGGASTQIATQIGPDAAPVEGATDFEVYSGRSWHAHVRSVSLLGFGKKEAVRAMHSASVAMGATGNACRARGDDALGLPGTSNAPQCEALVDSVFATFPVQLAPLHPLAADAGVIGMDNYHHTALFFGIDKGTLDSVAAAASEYCTGLEWASVLAAYASRSEDRYQERKLHDHCFVAFYAQRLASRAFGVDTAATTIDFSTEGLSWAYGAALVEAQRLTVVASDAKLAHSRGEDL